MALEDVKFRFSSKDIVTFEETVKAAELFKKQTVTIIPNHSLRSWMWTKEGRKKINKCQNLKSK
jgi:hypothetical protein